MYGMDRSGPARTIEATSFQLHACKGATTAGLKLSGWRDEAHGVCHRSWLMIMMWRKLISYSYESR